MNKHKNFDPSNVWFKKGERQKLSNAVSCNNIDEAFDILFEMQKRGDL